MTTQTIEEFREESRQKFTCPDCGWFCVLLSNDGEHVACEGNPFGFHHKMEGEKSNVR